MRAGYSAIAVFGVTLVGACAAVSPNEPAGRAESRVTSASCNGGVGNACTVHALVVATGIRGPNAISQVPHFLRSSPFHDNPTKAAYTQAGRVLDPSRILVTSTSNYGAPLGNSGEYPGSVLSIDPNGGVVAVPANFAVNGGQASAADGAVQVYTANNTAFLNSVYNPSAMTAGEVGASLPLGISVNAGNGRPWLACAPHGANGDGTITVIDQDGPPLAGAPMALAGGVFAGDATNRSLSSTHGLEGTMATAIIHKSSDGSRRAVFAAAGADGSIVQVHVQKGVDGMVPPGTLTPITTITPEAAESNDPNTVVRVGLAFDWVPTRVLYATDPLANKVRAFDITADGTLFVASSPRLLGAGYDVPVDIAPTMSETASENFASNTTLAGGSDLYVLNRGDNTIVRVTRGGQRVATRTVVVDSEPTFRVSGLAVSSDGRTIWVAGQTAGAGGIVVKLDAFGSGAIMPSLMAQTTASAPAALGGFFFNHSFAVSEGVGPLFNATSCAGCHGAPSPGGMSSTIFDVFAFVPGEVITTRAHSISELGESCGLKVGVPSNATATAVRSSMTLRGTGFIDFIQDQDLLANMASQPDAVRGRPNTLADGRIGRFGWKANVATLVEFMGDAFQREQGLTNGLNRDDSVNGCGANVERPELDAIPLVTTHAFLATLDPPAPTACDGLPGKAVFASTQCASCHTPSFPGPGRTAWLYSDLLLHDMGPGLADGIVQGSATGSEFRTMTLRAMAERSHFLHDGRATSITAAIQAHGGQGSASKDAFNALSATDREALLAFLGCL